MEEKRYAPCPECGGLNGGHSNYKCPKMTLEEAQNKIIEVEQRWIKVNSRMAAGNQKSFSRLKTAIAFYQGKYTLLKEENNKLRQNATKLHQANEVIKVLTYDNNRLKGEVEGLNRWKEEAKAIINPIWEYADTLKVPLGESKTDAVIKHINEAKKLLNEVLVMNEAWGDLPGEFINKVKTFLYGE